MIETIIRNEKGTNNNNREQTEAKSFDHKEQLLVEGITERPSQNGSQNLQASW
jgi:hypothetical protein